MGGECAGRRGRKNVPPRRRTENDLRESKEAGSLSFLFLRPHQREEYCLAHRLIHQHREYPFGHAEPRRRRHAIFQSFQKIFIEEHRFPVPFFAQPHLFFKTIPLVDRIVQLRITVPQFRSHKRRSGSDRRSRDLPAMLLKAAKHPADD